MLKIAIIFGIFAIVLGAPANRNDLEKYLELNSEDVDFYQANDSNSRQIRSLFKDDFYVEIPTYFEKSNTETGYTEKFNMQQF